MTTMLNLGVAGALGPNQLATQLEAQQRNTTKAAAANMLPAVLIAAPVVVPAGGTQFVFFNNLDTSKWERFFLDFYGVYGSVADANFLTQFGTDNGGSWVTTGYNCGGVYEASSAAANWGHYADGVNVTSSPGGIANINSGGYGPGTTASETLAGYWEIINLGSTTEKKRIKNDAFGARTGYEVNTRGQTVHHSNFTPGNAVRCIMSSGNIMAGVMRLYAKPYGY